MSTRRKSPRDGRWWRVPDIDLVCLKVASARRVADLASREMARRRAMLPPHYAPRSLAHLPLWTLCRLVRRFRQFQQAAWCPLFRKEEN
jgi:hypothetical protein